MDLGMGTEVRAPGWAGGSGRPRWPLHQASRGKLFLVAQAGGAGWYQGVPYGTFRNSSVTLRGRVFVKEATWGGRGVRGRWTAAWFFWFSLVDTPLERWAHQPPEVFANTAMVRGFGEQPPAARLPPGPGALSKVRPGSLAAPEACPGLQTARAPSERLFSESAEKLCALVVVLFWGECVSECGWLCSPRPCPLAFSSGDLPGGGGGTCCPGRERAHQCFLC